MAFLELRKYRETSKDSIRKPWLEFFGNKPFTQQPERAISQADQLLDYKSWSEEDRKMFSQLRMREEQALLAQDYALETARAEGIEQGLERGRAEGIEQGLERGLERGKAEGREEGKLFAFLDMVRQGLLTSEVASHQLGMTVAEFEALLQIVKNDMLSHKIACFVFILFRGGSPIHVIVSQLYLAHCALSMRSFLV